LLCFVSLAAKVAENKGNLPWHDQNRRAIKARPIVTSCLGSGGTHSFEKKYVWFLFFYFNIFFIFTLCFDCNYVLALLQIDLYDQDPFATKLKKAHDIGTKALRLLMDPH
jgi:hypothetical protein